MAWQACRPRTIREQLCRILCLDEPILNALYALAAFPGNQRFPWESRRGDVAERLKAAVC
jgi:hypothetical protein